MKDFRFLYNRYVKRIRVLPGEPYKWDFGCTRNGVIVHDENFLVPFMNPIRFTPESDLLVDVGANVGAWTIRASPSFTRIVGFEPNPVFYRQHQRNLKLNHVKNVSLYNCALGNEEGIGLHRIIPNPSHNWDSDYVTERKLDGYDLKPSVIKIDVEGHALDVIRGANRTIHQTYPIIIVEVHSEEEAQAPSLLPSYHWQKFYRAMPREMSWLYLENGKQVFLVGRRQFS